MTSEEINKKLVDLEYAFLTIQGTALAGEMLYENIGEDEVGKNAVFAINSCCAAIHIISESYREIVEKLERNLKNLEAARWLYYKHIYFKKHLD